MTSIPSPSLQKPKWVFFGGKYRRWEECTFHISTEAVVRGLNVFEGLKGYWQADGSFGILAVERHWSRLKRSAKLLHIPFDMSLDEFENACHGLVRLLYRRKQNMWIRATLYVTDGHWGVGTKSDLVLTAYHTPKGLQEPMATGVSTWQRATDVALPYRIKTSSNYQVARLAKIEGRDRGYPEMILLNQHGRVAETIGSAVAIVRDGTVLTPPSWEGAFESITIDIVASLCETMGIPFARRPIDRTELIIADEMAIVSTLNEVLPITALDGIPIWRLACLQRPRPAVSTRRDRGAAASRRGAFVPPACPKNPAPPTAPPMPAVDQRSRKPVGLIDGTKKPVGSSDINLRPSQRLDGVTPGELDWAFAFNIPVAFASLIGNRVDRADQQPGAAALCRAAAFARRDRRVCPRLRRIALHAVRRPGGLAAVRARVDGDARPAADCLLECAHSRPGRRRRRGARRRGGHRVVRRRTSVGCCSSSRR